MSQQRQSNPSFLMPPPPYPPRMPSGPVFRVPHVPGPHVRGFPCHPRGVRPFFHRPPSLNQILRLKEKNKRKKEAKKIKKAMFTALAPPPSQPRSAWSLKDAERAANFEKEYNTSREAQQVRLEFPDLRPSAEELRCLHPNIREVTLAKPVVRFCYVNLKPDADVAQVLADLNSKPLPEFNGRCVRATLVEPRRDEVLPEDIDPMTLYIGNIPLSVTASFFKQLFPNRSRMSVGRSLKNNMTRYAFLRFKTLKEAIEAFKKVINLKIEDRELTVRFKRQHGARTWKNMSEADAASGCGSEDEFHYIPDVRSEDGSATTCDSSDDSDPEWYDPEEYDLEELHPPLRPPSHAVLRYLSSNDETETNFADYDSQRNVPILPEDVLSVQTTDSLLDLDTPYK